MARLHEVDVQAIDAARLEPLIGAERMAQFEQAAEAARESLAGALGVERQLDRGRRRRRRDAADAARLRARRRHRRALARDRGRPVVLRDHEADPQRPLRLPRRRRRARRRRSDATTSASCERTPTSCSRSSAPVTWSSSTTPSRPASSRRRKAPARGSSGAATSASTSRTSGPNARGSSCALPRRRRRDRRLPRSLRAAVGRSGAGARDPALDRPVLGQERADLAARTPAWRSATSGCSTVRPRRRPSSRSPAVTARPGGSTATST